MLQTKNPKLFYFLIVLGCMNFMGRGSIVFLLLCLYELFRRKGYVAIDRNAIAIGAFSLCVVFAAARYYSYFECIKAVNYLLMYILGYDSFRRSTDKQKCVEGITLAMCVGYGLELILMYLYNYNREQVSERSMYSIWTGEPIKVTLLGLLVSVIIGYSFFSIFYGRKKEKVVVVLLLAIGLLISFDTATRTPFALFAVVYAIMFMVHLFSKRGVRAFRVLALALLVCLIALLLYSVDVLGIKSALEESLMLQRFMEQGLKSSRMDLLVEHYELMLDHIWGGGLISEEVGEVAHNYLQQGHDLYGIFALIFLLAITAQFLRNMIRLFRKKNKLGIDILLLSLYLALVLQMCLEPVFTGYPILIWNLLMIHGMATAYLKDMGMSGQAEQCERLSCKKGQDAERVI